MGTIEDLMKSIVNTDEEIKKTMKLHNAMITERDCEISSLREELAAVKDEVNHLRDALTRNDLEKWRGEEGKRMQEHARLATAVEELLDAMQVNQPGDMPTIVFTLADTIKHRGMWIVNCDCDAVNKESIQLYGKPAKLTSDGILRGLQREIVANREARGWASATDLDRTTMGLAEEVGEFEHARRKLDIPEQVDALVDIMVYCLGGLEILGQDAYVELIKVIERNKTREHDGQH